MSNIHQMLSLNGGSFARAERMALSMIGKGQGEVLLDLALLYHAQGKIGECRKAQAEYAKFFPDCPRLRFGQTWFHLYDGDLEKGLAHVEAGRAIGCLGEHDFSKFEYPRWNGDSSLENKRVLLYGEGGAGDQIMGFRSAFWLDNLGARVVVACSKPLMGLFDSQGQFTVVDLEHAYAVKCDYWIPMMSSFRLCRRTWDTLWQGPYIEPANSEIWDRIVQPVTGTLDIGLRWRGNPEFEHEQLRWFPPELMFGLTKLPARFWSLQKDEPQSELPENLIDLEPLLGDWEQTAEAISRMDLVITSCTAIAHLAAAMGTETWVVVPAMPYYPWARPGRTSKWYPTVTLFRQKCYNKWVEPFMELHECLERKLRPTGVVEVGLSEFLKENEAKEFGGTWFMNGDEIAVIEALVRKYDIKSVLEIGVNKGETAKKLLDAKNSIERYVGVEITEDAVDSMEPRQRDERTRVGKRPGREAEKDKRFLAFALPNGSRDFVRHEPVRGMDFDMILVDGNHSYDWVVHDTELADFFNTKLVVWHDYGTEPGVTRYVDELARREDAVTRVLGTRLAYWHR